jgi:hypothetical protein
METDYLVVGGGALGMGFVDALIEDSDAWILNRAYFQPGVGVVQTFEGIVCQLEAVAEW